MYYDHYGEALVNAFDQHGSYGLSTSITNPAATYDSESSPRFVNSTTLPFSTGAPPSVLAYPYAPPSNVAQGFAVTWGLDSKIKTPYTEAFNLSIQHQFAGGWTLETDYVGTMGRHLLEQVDLAEPVNYVDPGGGGSYYSAGAELSHLVDVNNGNYGVNAAGTGSIVNVPSIPYFEDVFPWMVDFDYTGESATQAIYNNEWAPTAPTWGRPRRYPIWISTAPPPLASDSIPRRPTGSRTSGRSSFPRSMLCRPLA